MYQKLKFHYILILIVCYMIFEANLNFLDRIVLEDGAAAILHKVRNLPALPKVTSLKLLFRLGFTFELREYNEVYEFISSNEDSPKNSLSNLFPNLEKLEFSVWNVRGENFTRKLFPFWNNRLMSVTTLKTELHHYGGSRHEAKGSNAIFMSLKLCPKIEALELFWPYFHFPLLAATLWTLTNLKSLRLEFNLRNMIDDTFVDLDAAITGLSKEMILIIYNKWEKSDLWKMPKMEEERMKSRVNSSILNLQSLQNLSVEFVLNYEQKPRRLISGVSAKFGVDFMKNLKVAFVLNCTGSIPRCPDCVQNGAKESWRKFHEPLLSFPNFALEIK